MLAEDLKTRAEEFGGFQSERVPSNIIEGRLCAAKHCGEAGRIQIPVPGGYRIVCGRHGVVVHMMVLGLLGDPSPVPEIREYAERLGVRWDELLTTEPVHPAMPIWFTCLQCGRGLEEEYSDGKSVVYSHVCGG